MFRVSSAAGQVQDSFAVNGQISAAAGFSTNTDDMGVYSLTFTDGEKCLKKSKLSKCNIKHFI